MTLLEKLATICDPSHPAGEHVRRPFLFRFAAEPWTIATNGHLLLALRGEHGAAAVPSFAGDTDIAEWFGSGPADRNVSGRRLRMWAGSAKQNKCGECNGTGKETNTVACDWCDGTGKVAPMRPGRLRDEGGILINRYLLARGLALVDVPETPLLLGIADHLVVRILAPDWRILLARLVNTGTETYEVVDEPAELAA